MQLCHNALVTGHVLFWSIAASHYCSCLPSRIVQMLFPQEIICFEIGSAFAITCERLWKLLLVTGHLVQKCFI